MMKKLIWLPLVILLATVTQAQDNPYESLGIDVKVITLSNGKYKEFFDDERFVQIGNIVYDIEEKKLVWVINRDSLPENFYLLPLSDSRWISPDPLSDEFTSVSPYNYGLNNPIRFNDPTGLAPESPLDDYKLNQDGTVELIQQTDDATDRLFAYHLDGEPTGESLEVEKGILDVYQQNEKSETSLTGDPFSSVSIKGDEAATELFEFFAENTIVEFSQTKFNEDDNIISTSHKSGGEGGSVKIGYDLVVKGDKVRESIHSHPTDGAPSPADKSNATYWKGLPNQNITLKIYKTIAKEYVEYDGNGIKKN